MRRLRQRLGAVLLVGLALVVTAPADAAEVAVEVGWWSSNPAANAPERGFAVSAAASGTVTVAALRAPTDVSTIESATLTLTEEGGVQQSGAALQVCPTPNAWKGGAKQRMAEAPKPECDVAKAPLTRDANGTWTADVRTVLSSSSAGDPSSPSLMVVPAGAGAVPVGFEVRFNPPKLDITGPSTSSSGSSTSGSGSSFDDDFAAPGAASAPASSSFDDSFSGSSSSSFSSPSDARSPLPSFSSAQVSGTFEASPTAEDTAAAEVAPTATAEVAAEPAVTPAAAARAPSGGGSRTVQALFFVLVATVIGTGAGFAHARFRPEVELLR